MKLLLKNIKIISILILTISFLGCEDDDTLPPEVISSFSFTLNEDTGTVTFLNISEKARTYLWDFGDGTSSTEINPIKTYASGTYTIILTASNTAGASSTFEDELTVSIPGPPPVFDSGLLTNGGFENGTDSWIGNAANAVTEGGNTFNQADVETAGNAFDVNLSQVLELTQGTNYILTFDASSNGERTIIAGIGLNVDPFTNNTQTVNLTAEIQTFTLELSATEFGGADSRVLFDMGADTGIVVIDNVSLVEGGDGGETGGGDLVACDGGELVNDFETADDSIFSNFGGGVGTIIDNPDTSVNSSAKVGQYVKNAGEDFGGITIALDSNIDLNNGVFSMDVNSQAVRQLLFKLEGLNQELIIPTSGTGWETIEYDFTGNMGEVTGITLIMDNGTAGDGSADWTIQFDNIRLCSNESTGDGGLVECSGGELVNDFETADDSIFSNFGGGVGTIIDNPDTSVNSSAKVAQYVKNAGEVFGGITIALDSNIDLNNGVFSIDVNSQAVRQLLFKLEGLNQELIIPTSGTGWETIEYDFTGNMGEVTGITLIMDNGTAGDGSADWTIQFDNIRLCSNESTGGGGLVECSGGELVNDFETADDSIFSNFGGGVGTIIDNLDTSVNSSAKVAQYVKNAGEVFGGITIALDSNIDLNNGVFSIDVNSQAVRQLLFKLEGLNQELIIPTSGTGWETIEYDFTGNMGEVTGITLIMDNGTAGDGSADWTIQFDNIRLCSNESTGGGSCPAPPMGELLSNGGFEANSGDGSCWQQNQGGGSVTIIDTDANTGTYSARLTTGPAQVPNLKQERFAPTVAGSQNIQVTFQYKITTAFVDGSILQVLAFSERTVGGAFQHDLGNAAGTNTVDVWQTYTGTFTTDAGVDEGLSLLIQATCGGAGTCAGEVLIDDVVVTEI